MGAALDALVNGRQVTGAPDGFTRIRIFAAGGENDEAGEILVFRAEAIGSPGTDGRGTGERGAGVDEELSRTVVKLVGVHGFDETNLIGDTGEMGQAV